ncbi:MAG: EcsC family protein [Geminicoccaceae bacterium]|nr:EcsC family protein [Geminicoccaceae bacterium]MCS7268422.1 EcsC family protein [Geminicoccaceae bacterium]MDW8124925.1 EcsC family protein [Geminicoccaceae bacterium]MDW8340973.1 EcsC family protein [Geminicoccaceae bacterium]
MIVPFPRVRPQPSVAGPTLPLEAREELERAWLALERPSFAAQLSSILGTPIDQILRLLPEDWSGPIRRAAEAAVVRAYDVAAGTLEQTPPPTGLLGHRLAAALTGAVGGFFGLPALLLELPTTTLVMLRAIADVARANGEDPRSPKTRLSCVKVFAIGGRSHADDYAELGYYELRLGLAWQFTNVPALDAGAASALPQPIGLLRAIGARFGVVVTDKAAAQLVPVFGALAGAAVNTLFMEHFLSVADGHFTVRRLERTYGRPAVEAAYRAIGARYGKPGSLKRVRPRRRNRRVA